jgi:hypothetical protein
MSGRRHVHAGMPRHDFRQQALVVAREVRDNNECHPGVGRHSIKQQLQGFDSSGGGADPDDGESSV